jgi:hypothetical protein
MVARFGVKHCEGNTKEETKPLSTCQAAVDH